MPSKVSKQILSVKAYFDSPRKSERSKTILEDGGKMRQRMQVWNRIPDSESQAFSFQASTPWLHNLPYMQGADKT